MAYRQTAPSRCHSCRRSCVHRVKGKSRGGAAGPVYAVTLVRERYADFGPTLATGKLAERDGLRVSRETVRSWMTDADLWLSRKQRRAFHQPRLRREAYGKLGQIDGSEHRWFEDLGPPCSLLVFVDDATGKLMQLCFVRSESAFTSSAYSEREREGVYG